MKLDWVDGFSIKTRVEYNEIIIRANAEGLLSLANHLIKMADEQVLKGYHLHLDELNSLEDNSVSLIIEKI